MGKLGDLFDSAEKQYNEGVSITKKVENLQKKVSRLANGKVSMPSSFKDISKAFENWNNVSVQQIDQYKYGCELIIQTDINELVKNKYDDFITANQDLLTKEQITAIKGGKAVFLLLVKEVQVRAKKMQVLINTVKTGTSNTLVVKKKTTTRKTTTKKTNVKPKTTARKTTTANKNAA